MKTPILGFTFHDTINVNNLGTFIPEVWANSVLGRLENQCPMMQSVRKDFSDDVAQEGSTVKIPKTGALVTHTKLPNTPVTLQNPTGTTVDVVLDTHKEVSFLVEDVAEAESHPAVADSYTADAAIAIGEDIESSLLAEYANVPIGNVIPLTKLSGIVTPDCFITARTKILVTGKSGTQPRYLVIKDLAEFLPVEKFINADYIAGKPLETGQVGSIVGFNVKETALCIQTTSPTQTHRMAWARDGIALVTRRLPDPPAGCGVVSATINRNGVGLRVLRGYNMSYLGMQVTVDMLWGTKLVRPEWVCVIED